MNFMAPNLTIILGSSTAAKLMGVAGGLTNLSKIPACNIMVLGNNKKTHLGLSSVMMQKHAGLVYGCPLIVSTPSDYKRKAVRVLSAKVALASRVDCAKESRDGHLGRKFREEIEKKIELILQPPPGKATKALPVPDEGPKKRRGGKRYL
jgi:U4/U6 small nuclear ribonucleoprotein PRP31